MNIDRSMIALGPIPSASRTPRTAQAPAALVAKILPEVVGPQSRDDTATQAVQGLRQRASRKRILIGTGIGALLLVGTGVGVGLFLKHRGASAGATGSTVGAASGANATNTTTAAATLAPWLVIEGNAFYQAAAGFSGFGIPEQKTPFLGRGANMQDTRDCRLCATDIPLAEVLRRIDALSSIPGVNMMRLTLESDNTAQTLTANSSYAQDVKAIIDYAGTKPNFYVQASIWIDPTLSKEGRPTNATHPQLQQLVKLTGNASHVLFGVSNEPTYNYSGANDTLVFEAMNGAVDTIRQAELSLNVPQHIVSVQGTRAWAGDVSYYVDNPITAGNGTQIAYELHAYFNNTLFNERIISTAARIPLLIGEFGPSNTLGESQMYLSDANDLMTLARSLNVPHIAWTFNPRCGPSLMDDVSPLSLCPVLGAPITFNNLFGQAFVAGMAQAWT